MSSSRAPFRFAPCVVPLVAAFALLAVSASAGAQVIPRGDVLADEAFADPRLDFTRASERIDDSLSALAPEVERAWSAVRESPAAKVGVANPEGWVGTVDRRTGRLDYAEGPGLAWLPGSGNELSRKDLESRFGTGAKADLATLERIARAFLAPLAPALGVDLRELVLSSGRSGRQSDYLWFVDFDVVRGGLPVDGGRVFFRINNGNLIQFGTEGLAAPGVETKSAAIDRARAEAIAAAAFGKSARIERVVEAKLDLVALALDTPGRPGEFAPGKGAELKPVWEISVTRSGSPWRVRIDAVSGEVLALEDLRDFATAKVQGGVFADATAGEPVLPFPFADLSVAPGATNSAGLYNYPGGTVTSALAGTFVKISDTCGSISQTSDGSGNIDFLTQPGTTDCSVPASGGTGNTHSARTQFYWVNRIKEIGRGWLPGNVWLTKQLTVNVNLNQTCNAYWDPPTGTLNFFKSGGGCGNSGELTGVSLHEYGHGLDQNDGLAGPDSASRESYADITSVLMTHNSCSGTGFIQGGICDGYGDPCLSCSGVRDIDWAKHEGNTAHTVANFVQPFCPVKGKGICGTEGHCESYIATESIWDFVNRDLPSAGSSQAWNTAERLWYLSRPTATKAWTCDKSQATWSSDGCNSGSLFRVLRAADDDDGNLNNGTPHGAALFAALDRHGIACASDAGAGVTKVGCTPPPVPALTVTAGNNQNSLSWSNSGNGIVYDVFRSESGCNSGFAKIKEDNAGLNLTDSAVSSASFYAYQVVAQPAGNEACASAPSPCKTVTGLGAVDLWSKDKTFDTGLEPDPTTANSHMWESRDIWVRNDATPGSHQNPKFGQTNFVNVRLYNKSETKAVNAQVIVYWAQASAGLAWPIDWQQVGSAVTDVDAQGTVTVQVPWIPAVGGHVCLLVRIVTPQDPIHPEGSDPNDNVRNNNNLVWRNVNVVGGPGFKAEKVSMIVRNIDPEAPLINLSFHDRLDPEVRTPFLRRGAVTVDLGEKLFDLWRRGGAVGRDVELAGETSIRILADGAWIQVGLRYREEHPIDLLFENTKGGLETRTEQHVFEVREDNARTGKVLGGVTYEIEAPMIP